MIRKFELFCKLINIKKSDLSLIQESLDSFVLSMETCPACGAKHSCSLHGNYNRDLIVIKSGLIVNHSVSIPRVICSSCSHTHAILPAVLVPYGSYSLFFILTVLKDYFLRSGTIDYLCTRYQISVSTLYSWIHLFYSQKRLWLGLLKDLEISSLDFLSSLMSTDSFLESFFCRFSISFLQFYHFTTSSHLP